MVWPMVRHSPLASEVLAMKVSWELVSHLYSHPIRIHHGCFLPIQHAKYLIDGEGAYFVIKIKFLTRSKLNSTTLRVVRLVRLVSYIFKSIGFARLSGCRALPSRRSLLRHFLQFIVYSEDERMIYWAVNDKFELSDGQVNRPRMQLVPQWMEIKEIWLECSGVVWHNPGESIKTISRLRVSSRLSSTSSHRKYILHSGIRSKFTFRSEHFLGCYFTHELDASTDSNTINWQNNHVVQAYWYTKFFSSKSYALSDENCSWINTLHHDVPSHPSKCACSCKPRRLVISLSNYGSHHSVFWHTLSHIPSRFWEGNITKLILERSILF